MSGKRIFAFIMIALFLAAFSLNPTKEELKFELRNKVTKALKKELGIKHADAYELAMTLYGNELVTKVMNNYLQTKNYYLFSTVEITWQGDKAVLGGGAFKQIWFSDKIDEKIREVIEVLKDIG